MSAHRYRITVTPIQSDGQQCSGRCTIEFEQHSEHDWMRLLESAQAQRRLSCNEDATLVVTSGLLRTLVNPQNRNTPNPLANLQPELDQLLAKLEKLQHG